MCLHDHHYHQRAHTDYVAHVQQRSSDREDDVGVEGGKWEVQQTEIALGDVMFSSLFERFIPSVFRAGVSDILALAQPASSFRMVQDETGQACTCRYAQLVAAEFS